MLIRLIALEPQCINYSRQISCPVYYSSILGLLPLPLAACFIDISCWINIGIVAWVEEIRGFSQFVISKVVIEDFRGGGFR